MGYIAGDNFLELFFVETKKKLSKTRTSGCNFAFISFLALQSYKNVLNHILCKNVKQKSIKKYLERTVAYCINFKHK